MFGRGYPERPPYGMDIELGLIVEHPVAAKTWGTPFLVLTNPAIFLYYLLKKGSTNEASQRDVTIGSDRLRWPR